MQSLVKRKDRKWLWWTVFWFLLYLPLGLGCDPTEPPAEGASEQVIDAKSKVEETYELVVERQSTSDGNSLVIEKLNALTASWLTIVKKNPKSPNDIYATLSVPAGRKSQWSVTLENPIEADTNVEFSLYIDDGDGKFDATKDKLATNSRNTKLKLTVLIKYGASAKNILEVEDQTLILGATKSINIKLLQTETPSTLMIFSDKSGKPDKLLGRVSRSMGESKDFKVNLTDALQETQQLHAIVYDGSKAWTISTPKLQDELGKDLQKIFKVTLQDATQGALLRIEDQAQTSNFREVVVQEAGLPPTYKTSAVVAIYIDEKGQKGKQIGAAQVKSGAPQQDIPVSLDEDIVGSQILHAVLEAPDGKPFTDENKNPLQTTFQVQGDTSTPALAVDSQEVPLTNLRQITISLVTIPKRSNVGWVAIYADDAGKPGKLLGKKSFQAGENNDQSFNLDSKLTLNQTLHAALHEGRPGSGSWSNNNPVMMGGAGEIRGSFRVNSIAFNPALEVPDQIPANGLTVTIDKVTIPADYFFGHVAIYEDNAGQRGRFLGNLQLRTGTRTNQTIKLNAQQQGQKTLHATLHTEQIWTGNNPVMRDQAGNEVTRTFQIGAKDLNYLKTPDTISAKPTVVVVSRAHAHKTHGWVVLARDNNGKPGEILGKKRVLPRFAGLVYITLDSEGRTHEYLRGKGVRKYVKGKEKLHVLFYEDNPTDNKFTYKPGGTEDLPLLDANNKPVVARLNVTVKGSLQNSQNESQYFYKQCTLSQYVSKPSALPVDCRCNRNAGGAFPTCLLIGTAHSQGFSFGKGPQVATLNIGRIISGFTEKSSMELISVIKWLDVKPRPENQIAVHVGAVMAIHVETGERRLISGRYNDAQKGTYDIGKGPVISYPFEIQKGPNGKYYVAGYGYTRDLKSKSLIPTVDVISVDPKTGDRAYVWRSNHLGSNWDATKSTYGHCPNGRTTLPHAKQSVQFGRKAFAMDPQGNFYFSYAHNGNTDDSDGIGIAKISADGKTCTIVTSSKVGKNNYEYKGKNVGTGPEPQAGPYNGMLYKDGFLYATSPIGEQTYKIEVATGNREVIYTKSGSGQVFGSTATHIRWDPYRNLLWQDGLSSQVLLFDPVKKVGVPLGCPSNNRNFHGIQCAIFGTPWEVNPALEQGFWFHPTNPDIVFFSRLFSVVRYELSTGNNYIFSL